MFGYVTNIPETLAQRPYINDMGPIPNPEEFSRPDPQLFGAKGQLDVHLTDLRGGFFDIEKAPPQFRLAVAMAKAAYDEKFAGRPCPVELHLNQGWLEPNRNFRVVEPHFDPWVKAWPDNPGKPKESYMVSDALTTRFYDQSFTVPASQFQKIEDMGWALTDIFRTQADPAAAVEPPPHHMLAASPYAVHEARLSPERTFRTFMLLRFY